MARLQHILFECLARLSGLVCVAILVVWLSQRGTELVTTRFTSPQSGAWLDWGMNRSGFVVESYQPLTTPIVGPPQFNYVIVREGHDSWEKGSKNPAATAFENKFKTRYQNWMVFQLRRQPVVFGTNYGGAGNQGVTELIGFESQLILPYWLLAVLTAVLPAIWLGRNWKPERVLSPPATPQLCPACSYDLRATPDRCPECGLRPPARGVRRGACG